MTNNRLPRLVSAALRAQRRAAFDEPVERMAPALVDFICNLPPGPMPIKLPPVPAVDDETRMAARNGLDGGLPPELLDELREIERKDQEQDGKGDDGT